jgi:salicylate hydroxylase
MRVIVVGAGIGGLTAALALRRCGIEVQVFEQATELREVGAGVRLSSNATRLLHRLGCEAAMRAAGVRPASSTYLRWDDGRIIAREMLGEEAERRYGAPQYSFHRADLLTLLAAALPADIIHLGHRCVALQQHPGRVELGFDNGARAGAELVIGADGIHSMVRELIFGREAPRFSGFIAYRALIAAERLAAVRIEMELKVWLGPGHHFVQYPISGGRYMNFVAVAPADAWRIESWTATGEVADALREFAGWHPEVRAIIGAAQGVNKTALYDRDPLPAWTTGRVALMGDAAHPMLPLMAMGAVQSIEDAVVLARCLEGVVKPDGLAIALKRYQQLRMPRAIRAQQGSRRNTVVYHLPDGEEQRRRDAGFADLIRLRAEFYAYDAEAEFLPQSR